MGDYTANMEIILDVNLVIINLIIINGIYLGFCEKLKNIKFLSFIYFLEAFIYLNVLVNKDINYDISKYFFIIYIVFKAIYFYALRDIFKLNSLKINLFMVINLAQFITLNFNLPLFFVLNIVSNIAIYKMTILNSMKQSYKNLKLKNDNIIKANKIKCFIDNKIRKINNMKVEYREDISTIEDKINKSIEISDMPIIILDEKNELVYCNKNYWNSNNLSKTNLLSYLRENFKNGTECIDMVNEVKLNEHNYTNVYSNDGRVYRVICAKEVRDDKELKICIFNDITQSTLIQKQLKESDDKYKKLMDLLTDGVMIHNNVDINYINDSAMKIFNIYKGSSNVNIDLIKEKIGNSNLKKFNETLQLVSSGKVRKIVNKFKIGIDRYIELITTKIELEEDDVLLSIVVDISDMELSIKKLADSKKTYQALAENLPDGIVVIDKDSKDYIYQNKSMMKILKTIKIDSINKSINDYIHNRYFGKTVKYETNEGSNYSVGITIINMKEENQLLAIIRPLEQEERIIEAIKELDLIKAQHKVKNKLLNNTIKLLNEPIVSISDINKKLDSNKDKYNSKHINNYTKLVKKNCYRLQRLIKNINEVVEVENGLYNTEFVYCDIVLFTKNIVKSMNDYLENEGIQINFKTEIESTFIKADLDKIQRIILNLVSNSIKFSNKEGKITISLSKDKEYVYICVIDKGVGIPKDRLNFIFTKFGQIDKSLSRNTEGCGVGLSLVKAFAKIHGGEVMVESEEGKGSKFTIKLKESKVKNNESIVDINQLELSITEKMNMEFADIYF